MPDEDAGAERRAYDRVIILRTQLLGAATNPNEPRPGRERKEEDKKLNARERRRIYGEEAFGISTRQLNWFAESGNSHRQQNA